MLEHESRLDLVDSSARHFQCQSSVRSPGPAAGVGRSSRTAYACLQTADVRRTCGH
jgi:hypothetical protein